MSPENPQDAWQLRRDKIVDDFGAALKELHDTNPWPQGPVLPYVLSLLAGDLWELPHFEAAKARDAWRDALSEFPTP